MAETFTFQAEIKQLLHTLIHSLYSDREIFLRELISNSSDALNRMQFEMLTDHNIRDADADLVIYISPDEEAGTLTISDTGIGLTHDEMIDNLGTISKSGIQTFLESLEGNTSISPTDLIGQFGVGFYSIFMVADKVEVISQSYKPHAEAVKWTSYGEETYEIEPATRDHRGTDVILYLKDDAKEYLKEYRLRQIVNTHSNYIAFPIYVGETEDAVNDQKAIWRRPSGDVKDEEYTAFYKSLTLDFKEPLLRIHSTADAPVQYFALLYIPSSREPNMFSPRKEPGLKLYARKVLIQDYCTDLLPEYLSFVQGVVDSEDLPLNVSRETVQANRIMINLEKAITGRVLRDLKNLANNDLEKYAEFGEEFGPFIKQGMVVDPQNHERLTPLLRFYSSQSEDKLISLDDYVQKMQEVKGQEAIYYVLADSKSAASHSPHLEAFRARGIDVLYFTETVDSFLINSLFEFNSHKLQNVDDEKLDLSEIGELAEPQEENEPVEDAALEALKTTFEEILGDRVQSVRISKVLTNRHPARLVSPEGSIDRHTQRVYRMLDKEYEVPRKILEINPRHILLRNLARLIETNTDTPMIAVTIEQLYENALLLDGLHPNPADMVERIQRLMEAATGREIN